MATTGRAPNLPFGDINLVVLTDVHSWVGGHPNEPSLDASYGDVVSFYQHIQTYCQETNQDVWLVQNGDWIDGTGLAMDGDPSHLVPLIQKMPFDVLNTGNHELYRSEVVEYMTRPGGFIDWWGDRYLASNVYLKENSGKRAQPLGNQYTILTGKHSKILVFGFLYNLSNPSDKVTVQHVEDAVKERWFHKALTETIDYNAIVVMTHAGHDDPAVTAVHREIRNIVRDEYMPIQFIAGHTHYRRYAVLDSQSTVVEAGRYLDTIGWVSFANRDTVVRQGRQRYLQVEDTAINNATDAPTASATLPPEDPETISSTYAPTAAADEHFRHVFLDAKLETLHQTLGISSDDEKFDTILGKEIEVFIGETRQKMGLSNKIGCAPKDYLLNTSMTNENSLWRLFAEEVVPRELGGDIPRAMFLGQGSWRYDLLGGNKLTLDDVIAVSPFNQPLYLVGRIPGEVILQLNTSMNDHASDRYYSPLAAWILAGHVPAGQECELYTDSYSLSHFHDTLRQLYPDLVDPIPQNMTSTTIWLSFVLHNWHCFGGVFDNQWWSQLDKQLLQSTSDSDNRTVAVILYIVAILSCCCVLVVLVYICRKVCCGVIRISDRKEYGEMIHEDAGADHRHRRTRSEDYSIESDNYDGDKENDEVEEEETPVRIV
ncbi:calcineurin-like phosphoesterase [Nitzschia inconspicua]|uniref:Calcineurin-like phosphoesterase n=1 Tax=Nitzschia inconspicua TaxID=303405 RepID=A0A9K3PJI6_9STRA|nr:calcineurin-like phosphoesterase [Nitzschia inconspicua]